jgi:hypothetical protein
MNGFGRTSDQKVPKVSPSSPAHDGEIRILARRRGQMKSTV